MTKSITLCILVVVIRKLFNKIISRIETPEAIVVTGMRRVGKTTLLQQVYDSIKSGNKIFLDLENPVNQKYFEEENFEAIKYKFQTLGMDLSKKSYIFLDEIQNVSNLPSVVKYLIDHYQIKFFLTGSSSFYLKNLFSESLAGRKIIYELFPLDFEEFLALKESKLQVPEKITKSIYQTIIPLYKEYIEFGGFPGVVTKTSVEEKREALMDIFSAYFNKEILNIGGFRNNQAVRDLMLLLISRVGSKIDVQKLAKELGITRVTVMEYLAFLEGTYFISLVAPYSTSKDTEIRLAKKVYLCDSGLVNNIASTPFGSLFENTVYHQLRTEGAMNYYQRKSGVEIDFILNKQIAYEVKTKATVFDQSRLQRLVKELKLKIGNIVSFEYSDIKTIYGFQL